MTLLFAFLTLGLGMADRLPPLKPNPDAALNIKLPPEIFEGVKAVKKIAELPDRLEKVERAFWAGVWAASVTFGAIGAVMACVGVFICLRRKE